MITNYNKFEAFEKELMRKERMDFRRKLSILDAMYREGASLGVFPLKNPLEGLEIDIKIARVVNCVSKSS